MGCWDVCVCVSKHEVGVGESGGTVFCMETADRSYAVSLAALLVELEGGGSFVDYSKGLWKK